MVFVMLQFRAMAGEKIYNGFSLWFYVPICKNLSPCLYYSLSREKINVQTILDHNWNIKPGNNKNRQSVLGKKVLKEKLFSLQKQFPAWTGNAQLLSIFFTSVSPSTSFPLLTHKVEQFISKLI